MVLVGVLTETRISEEPMSNSLALLEQNMTREQAILKNSSLQREQEQKLISQRIKRHEKKAIHLNSLNSQEQTRLPTPLLSLLSLPIMAPAPIVMEKTQEQDSIMLRLPSLVVNPLKVRQISNTLMVFTNKMESSL